MIRLIWSVIAAAILSALAGTFHILHHNWYWATFQYFWSLLGLVLVMINLTNLTKGK